MKNKKTETIVELEQVKELKVHTDARDARVQAVKDAIAIAKVARDDQEAKGLVETEGVKLDRLAKEESDLKAAEVLNVVEPFGVDVNDTQVQIVVDKLNEVIKFLNGSNSTKESAKEVKELDEVPVN